MDAIGTIPNEQTDAAHDKYLFSKSILKETATQIQAYTRHTHTERNRTKNANADQHRRSDSNLKINLHLFTNHRDEISVSLLSSYFRLACVNTLQSFSHKVIKSVHKETERKVRFFDHFRLGLYRALMFSSLLKSAR